MGKQRYLDRHNWKMCVFKCVWMLTLCPSWQEDPKSTILMADLLGLHNRMFSGFRSQWMIDNSGVARNNNAVEIKPILVFSHQLLHCLLFFYLFILLGFFFGVFKTWI